MTAEVVPLRSPAQVDPGEPAVPRAVLYPTGTTREQLAEACREHARIIERNESRLNALVAKALCDRAAPIEAWVGMVFTAPDPDDSDATVELTPRELAAKLTSNWTHIVRTLREPAPPHRLDVIVEAQCVIGLTSLDVGPALPVTRRQAEAVNLPAHLLFAKGEAFTSVREERADVASLLSAWTEHRRLVDARSEDLLEDLRKAARENDLRDCAGVVLSLGGEDQAVTAVTRADARRVVAMHPPLACRLDGRGPVRHADGDGDVYSVPIVVWAKGHVSVQSKQMITRERA